MKYTKVPQIETPLSVIGLGTWVFSNDAWGQVNEDESIAVIHAALDQGINLIDTAPIYGYGHAEKIVGKAIRDRRDKVFLATKCGLIGRGKGITTNLQPASIRQELDESLSRLQTDYVDLYQCHWPDPQTPFAETFGELSQMKAEGKIRHIGVSNFDTPLLEQAMQAGAIVTTQNPYSLLDRKIEKTLLPFCQKNSVEVLTYGSLAGGILSGKYHEPPKFNGGDPRSFFYKFYKGAVFEQTQRLLSELKKFSQPLSQIALNWVRQQPGISVALVGCRTPQQVIDNIAATDWDLSELELKKIYSLLEEIFPA